MANELRSDAWAPYEPTDAAPWNVARVVHLHRRAAFAASWPVIQRDLADGPNASVDRLLAGTVRYGQSQADFEPMARTIGEAAVASNNPNRLKAWWLYRMLSTPDPLGERLTLMWHNHFATSNRKVQDLSLMHAQNTLLREHARAPFGELLRAVVKHPALLVWLDADSNRQGRPNENLGRELLELFTLGVGNYLESDVRAAARALTGWTVAAGGFRFAAARHDGGEKTVFGHTGPLDGDDLLTALLENPATARRIAWRICHSLLGEAEPSDDELDALAAGLRQNNLDIGSCVETVLRSQKFFSADALRCRVAGPVEWTVGAFTALELSDPPPSTLLLAEWTTRMGQDLFYPPNVGGWLEGRSWLGSQSLIARANFAAALTAGRPWNPVRPPNVTGLVELHRPMADLSEAVGWFSELLWGARDDDAVAEVVSAARTSDPAQSLATAVALLMARPESQLT